MRLCMSSTHASQDWAAHKNVSQTHQTKEAVVGPSEGIVQGNAFMCLCHQMEGQQSRNAIKQLICTADEAADLSPTMAANWSLGDSPGKGLEDTNLIAMGICC